MKISEQKKEVIEAPKRIFTDTELEKFHEELQSFKVSQILRTKETISYIDFDKYHVFKGTMSERNTIAFDDDEFSEASADRYKRLEEKIKQYKNWCGRKEFTKNKIASELESLAETMKTNLDQ